MKLNWAEGRTSRNYPVFKARGWEIYLDADCAKWRVGHCQDASEGDVTPFVDLLEAMAYCEGCEEENERKLKDEDRKAFRLWAEASGEIGAPAYDMGLMERGWMACAREARDRT